MAHSFPKKLSFASLKLFFFCCLFFFFSDAFANNGKVVFVYPVEDISIDGNLSEWPKEITAHPINNFINGFVPENAQDCNATIRLGYNLSEQSLYVGVSVIDDHFFRTPENPQWNLQDAQCLHLDLDHTVDGAGVIGYEVSMDTAQIIHQKDNWFTAQVQTASWDNVELKIKRQGKTTIYEWRLFIGEYLAFDRTIGFDYMILDRDKEKGIGFLVWGPGNTVKHDNSDELCDLVFVQSNIASGKVKGQVKWAGKGLQQFPRNVRMINLAFPDLWMQASIDSNGVYEAVLPEGKYALSIPEQLMEYETEKEDGAYQIIAGNSPIVDVSSSKTKNIDPLYITKKSPPQLLPVKGLLHDFNEKTPAVVDRFIKRYQDYYNIPGVSLALIKEGKVIYHKTYGIRNLATNASITENTLFEAASITKPVFAYTVHRLAEKGIIDLDKPIHEYLPFEELEDNENYKLMTGRHVLQHTSGLPNWGRTLRNKPGTKYGYSGEGFEYLKRAIMHITGKPMQEILEEEVIAPSGLYNTHFSLNDQLKPVASEGHFDRMPTIQRIPLEPGMAWSMYTEAMAFSKFALHLLERKGLKPETYKEFMTMYNEYPLDEGEAKPKYREGMGQGISLRETPYGLAFGHGGNNGDFKCFFEIYDELKMGFIIFTNSSNGDYLHSDLAALLVEGNKAKELK